MENGFYKLEDGNLLFGQTIQSMGYTLTIETKDDNTYPVDGWYYFDTLQTARVFFDIVPPEPCCECPPIIPDPGIIVP